MKKFLNHRVLPFVCVLSILISLCVVPASAAFPDEFRDDYAVADWNAHLLTSGSASINILAGVLQTKSTYLVKLAQKHMKKGWIVYTNMDELCMTGVRHFDIQHLGDFVPEARSLLLLDEVGMIWDNRDYKLFKPSVRDFFKLQRHYHVKVYMASQTFDVDKKIRDLCDGMFLHQNFARVFTVGKRIVRKVVITQSTSEAESRISEDLVMLPFWDWTFTYIPRWAKFFDSHSIPDKPTLAYTTDD